MQLYKTTIKPLGNFATELKGDTLFGQLCWAIRYKFKEDRLIELLHDYEEKPFLIVSDGFAKGYLPKPTAPSSFLKEESDLKKENRKKIWLTLEDLENKNFKNAKRDKDIGNNQTKTVVVKNSLNYRTFTTGEEGVFAPYGESETSINQRDIYFLLDETKFSLKELDEALTLLSQMGYGKNQTIGKGFFSFSDFKKVTQNIKETDEFMTLSPSILQDLEDKKEVYYEPFTRFGKHGASLSNKTPFKKPILMANSGAVIILNNKKELKYIGQAIKGHSSHKDTVHQGYSIVIALKGE